MTHYPAQLPLDFSIHDEFSFANFVTGAATRELVAALCRIRQGGEHFYFIWGSGGVGKTHLLQAVCHANERAAYVPLAKFADASPELLRGLEELDVVCLDDVDAVIGRRDWEECLFECFNAIRERGKRLVMSAATAPRGLPTVLPDLASRLRWGVVYQLPELDDGGKAQALRSRAHGRGFELGDETLNYILLRSARGMDSLCAVLDQLDQLSLREKRKITIPFVRDIMGW